MLSSAVSPILPLEDAARQRAGLALSRASAELDSAIAELTRLRAETGWTSRGLRALQETLAEVQAAAMQDAATLEWVRGAA